MSETKLLVNYIEFPLINYEETKTFYQSVLGWEFQDWGPDYMAFSGAGIDLGFGRGVLPSKSSGVLVVLKSDNLELALATIRDAGCQVNKEIFEFPGGRRFHFEDPNGNELAVWSDAELSN